MEFDLGLMTLMSVFFKNIFWLLWLYASLPAVLQFYISVGQSASDSKLISGEILTSFAGLLCQAL